jgi:hypothetical protein
MGVQEWLDVTLAHHLDAAKDGGIIYRCIQSRWMSRKWVVIGERGRHMSPPKLLRLHLAREHSPQARWTRKL